jgi:hypothetical protein
LLLVQVKSSGGGSEQIRGAAGFIFRDFLAKEGSKDRITGLVFADTVPEARIRYACIRAIYDAFGGSPSNADMLNERLTGNIPSYTGITDEVRQAFYKQVSSGNPEKLKMRFERTLKELQCKSEKALTADETLKFMEPIEEMFGFRELIALEVPKLGDTITGEQALATTLGSDFKVAQEIVSEAAKSAPESSESNSPRDNHETTTPSAPTPSPDAPTKP